MCQQVKALRIINSNSRVRTFDLIRSMLFSNYQTTQRLVYKKVRSDLCLEATIGADYRSTCVSYQLLLLAIGKLCCSITERIYSKREAPSKCPLTKSPCAPSPTAATTCSSSSKSAKISMATLGLWRWRFSIVYKL